jgi:sugar lactone lactonase YvrE
MNNSGLTHYVSGAARSQWRLSIIATLAALNGNARQSFRLVRSGLALACLSLIVPLTLHAQSPAASGTVLTIAGNGVLGLSGDGGPATNAAFNNPLGLAVGPDGTLYFADSDNFRIRAVNPTTGIISTIAGTVLSADGYGTGDGGPATNAAFGTIFSVAVDRARNALYLGDTDNNRVRKVNLTSGIISNYAGSGLFNFGFSGDGGPATLAKIEVPLAVATDGAGRLCICDLNNNRIRQVDPVTGIITTIAGNGGGTSTGDGGPAANATLAFPDTVAADAAGNVFILDIAGGGSLVTNYIRRIDAVTGIITRVAGGGTNMPGTGPATNMNIGDCESLTVDPGGRTLYISGGATVSQVFKVDLATGQLTPFAGDGTADFSGDGGPALSARFNGIVGLTLAPGGGLVISDSVNRRLRYVVPDSITLTNDSQQTAFYLPWVSALAGDLTIANNPSLTNVNAGSLTNVAGNVSVISNTTTTTIDLGSLQSAGGTVDVSQNTAATTVDLSSLMSAGGTVSVSSNTTATTVALGSLQSAGGTVDVSQNTAATTVDLSSLMSAGGAVNVSSNSTATTVALGSLQSAGGTVDVSQNTAAGTIDLRSLTNINGNLTITSNAPNATIFLNGSTSVGGGTNDATIRVADNVVVTNGLTIGTNATLAGTATVDGSVTNNGTISPGNSPGRFDINGRLVLANTSKLRLELGGYTPGSQFDFVNVTGSVTLSGTLSVSLVNHFPGVMTNGASFTVLTAGSPLTGAFANVASGGTLTTTDGYARFTVRYAGETALRLTDLVIVDTDHDGLPDWWEDQFGLNKNDSADAALDSDGDGASNLNEFLAGTDPNDPASVFRIVTVQPEAGALRITWSTVGGKSYVVQTNAPPANGNFTNNFADFSPLITMPGTGEATTNFVHAGVITNAPARYYRVRLGP